jgi:hypothetical protein
MHREELSATRALYDAAAAPQGRPLIIFNGELDRLRGGYYPSWGFPELAKLTREFLPSVECAYYVSGGGWLVAPAGCSLAARHTALLTPLCVLPLARTTDSQLQGHAAR